MGATLRIKTKSVSYRPHRLCSGYRGLQRLWSCRK